MDPPASTPIFTFDAGYDAVQLSLALADLPIGLLVRLRAGLVAYCHLPKKPSLQLDRDLMSLPAA